MFLRIEAGTVMRVELDRTGSFSGRPNRRMLVCSDREYEAPQGELLLLHHRERAALWRQQYWRVVNTATVQQELDWYRSRYPPAVRDRTNQLLRGQHQVLLVELKYSGHRCFAWPGSEAYQEQRGA